MRAYEFTTDAKSGKTIKLALFSDVHFDSPDCDRVNLKKHLDFCLKDGGRVLLGTSIKRRYRVQGEPRRRLFGGARIRGYFSSYLIKKDGNAARK